MCVSELSSDIKSATNSMDHLNTYMKQEYSQVSKQVRLTYCMRISNIDTISLLVRISCFDQVLTPFTVIHIEVFPLGT